MTRCPICTEPESLCRCEESPATKLASQLVREAIGTYSVTVSIKQGDLLTLCERAYAWGQHQSGQSAAPEALLSEPKPHDLPPGLERLYCAALPFVKLVKDTSGHIPTERLSLANWHELVKAYDACAPSPLARR